MKLLVGRAQERLQAPSEISHINRMLHITAITSLAHCDGDTWTESKTSIQRRQPSRSFRPTNRVPKAGGGGPTKDRRLQAALSNFVWIGATVRTLTLTASPSRLIILDAESFGDQLSLSRTDFGSYLGTLANPVQCWPGVAARYFGIGLVNATRTTVTRPTQPFERSSFRHQK